MPKSLAKSAEIPWRFFSAFLMAKYCYDLALLCIDNQHLFLQCHAAIFVPVSGGETNWLGHLSPQIYIESHSSVNLWPVFYMKAYLQPYLAFQEDVGWISGALSIL